MSLKSLANKKIVFLGGDAREIELMSILLKQGVILQTIGQPPEIKFDNLSVINSIDEIDKDTEVIIAPMTGVSDDYQIKKTFENKEFYLNEEFFSKFEKGTKFFIGFAKNEIKNWIERYQLELIELAALDEVAILNAIPTAEGAIEVAMAKSAITLHNSNSFVLGLGRVGFTMARTLKGLGSNVYGVARKSKDLARALDMGFYPVDFQNLDKEIAKADFIFNTVPVMILDEALLKRVKSEAIIIDLASYPGGTDFDVAEKLGIKAELALGLPGKVAPKSAGQILAKVIPRFILA